MDGGAGFRQDEAGKGGSGNERPADDKPMSRGRTVLLIGGGVALAAAAVAGGTLYWLHAQQLEAISPQAVTQQPRPEWGREGRLRPQ